MSDPLKVPRLPKGKYFRGPDYYGCCNTGTAPIILHSRHADRYVVGPEFFVVERAQLRSIHAPSKRIIRDGNETAYVYKTRKPAVAKYLELCNAALARNAEIAAKHAADRKAAQAGDMEAALRLLDY